MKRTIRFWMAAVMAAVMAAGCSDDGDSDGLPAQEETAGAAEEAEGGGGEATADSTGTAIRAEQLAPQLVSPADGAEYTVYLFGGTAKVAFRWTALEGADSYSLRMENVAGGYVFGGTSGSLDLPVGTYTWWVCGRYPVDEDTVEDGPASEKFSFTVKQGYFQIQGP